MSSTWGNAGGNIVDNVVTTFYHNCINLVLQRRANHEPSVKTTLAQRCMPSMGIVVYNVEPTLDQRRNAIWGAH